MRLVSCDATTKATIVQKLLLEVWWFADSYLEARDLDVLMKSCGPTSVIETCFGGRNRKVSESYVTTGKVRHCGSLQHILLEFVIVKPTKLICYLLSHDFETCSWYSIAAKIWYQVYHY